MSTVSDILSRKGRSVVSVETNHTVMDAVRLMNTHRIGAVVVIDKETVVGIFTERDLLTRIVGKGLSPDQTRIGEVMSTPIAYCSPETEIAECGRAMTQKRIRHLPVIDNGRLSGLVSVGDVMAWELSDQQSTIKYLKEYIYTR